MATTAVRRTRRRQEDRSADSRQRLITAAAVEFAARGFAGARVDRIARRARVNKAMIYYHFASKQRLYRVLLRTMFSRAADALRAAAAGPAAPVQKLDRAIADLGRLIAEHPV